MSLIPNIYFLVGHTSNTQGTHSEVIMQFLQVRPSQNWYGCLVINTYVVIVGLYLNNITTNWEFLSYFDWNNLFSFQRKKNKRTKYLYF